MFVIAMYATAAIYDPEQHESLLFKARARQGYSPGLLGKLLDARDDQSLRFCGRNACTQFRSGPTVLVCTQTLP